MELIWLGLAVIVFIAVWFLISPALDGLEDVMLARGEHQYHDHGVGRD